MSRDPHLESLFHELCYNTLSHNDRSFIHQVVVDAYAAQTAGETSKPIRVAFALLPLIAVNRSISRAGPPPPDPVRR